ncbi:hypothetical protein J2S55_009597 [Streptosporangium brasiliense]|uniref:Uncharacterized protein n=1 Tax=Streptosporangium brasiliense TaxID=47480 RepID=A0ABT9RNG5_9ACTN|nr:hypothetical protein [Streptosporangium brasiliense]
MIHRFNEICLAYPEETFSGRETVPTCSTLTL